MKIFTTVAQKFYGMLSLTTMLTMTTFKAVKLTKNTILVTGIGRGWAEALPALGNKVIIAGRWQDVHALSNPEQSACLRCLCSAGKKFGHRIR